MNAKEAAKSEQEHRATSPERKVPAIASIAFNRLCLPTTAAARYLLNESNPSDQAIAAGEGKPEHKVTSP